MGFVLSSVSTHSRLVGLNNVLSQIFIYLLLLHKIINLYDQRVFKTILQSFERKQTYRADNFEIGQTPQSPNLMNLSRDSNPPKTGFN